MMNFTMLTISLTLAIVLGGFISVAIYFAVIMNTKFLRWFMKRYMTVIKEIAEDLDDYDL